MFVLSPVPELGAAIEYTPLSFLAVFVSFRMPLASAVNPANEFPPPAEAGGTTVVLVRARGQGCQIVCDCIPVGVNRAIGKQRDAHRHGYPDHDDAEDNEQQLLLSHRAYPS